MFVKVVYDFVGLGNILVLKSFVQFKYIVIFINTNVFMDHGCRYLVVIPKIVLDFIDFICDPFITVILCIFIIKISENTELWSSVISDVNMSPIVILIAWGVMMYSVMKAGIGGYILFTKDRKSET